MGYLLHGSGVEYEFDDRTLTHLKVVMSMKLRRRESFFLSWTNSAERGSGRVSLWVSPDVPLIFRFTSLERPELNRVWIDVLNQLSHTPRGLVILSESAAEAYAKEHGDGAA